MSRWYWRDNFSCVDKFSDHVAWSGEFSALQSLLASLDNLGPPEGRKWVVGIPHYNTSFQHPLHCPLAPRLQIDSTSLTSFCCDEVVLKKKTGRLNPGRLHLCTETPTAASHEWLAALRSRAQNIRRAEALGNAQYSLNEVNWRLSANQRFNSLFCIFLVQTQRPLHTGGFWLLVTKDSFPASLNNKEFLVTHQEESGDRTAQSSLIQPLEHSIEDLNYFHPPFYMNGLPLALFIWQCIIPNRTNELPYSLFSF